MKKLIKTIALALALVSIFAFAGCKKTVTKNVVVKEIELTVENYAFCFKKGANAELQAAANELISDLKADGIEGLTLEGIINSFSDETATFTYSNPASSTGCLVIGTNAEFAPFEYMSGDKFTGIDIQLAKLLADKVGKTLYVENMDFEAIFPALDTNQVDIGIAGITVTPKRDITYDFSTPYFNDSSQVLIVREDDTVFTDCTTKADVEAVLSSKNKKFVVGTQNATTGYLYCKGDAETGYAGFANITVKSYKTGALALKALSTGKINAVVLDKLVAQQIVATINK